MEAEKAAVAWAENGVMRLRDVMNGTNLITRRRFAELYPKVEEEGMLLELRNGFPKAWDNALEVRDVALMPSGVYTSSMGEGMVDTLSSMLSCTLDWWSSLACFLDDCFCCFQ